MRPIKSVLIARSKYISLVVSVESNSKGSEAFATLINEIIGYRRVHRAIGEKHLEAVADSLAGVGISDTEAEPESINRAILDFFKEYNEVPEICWEMED